AGKALVDSAPRYTHPAPLPALARCRHETSGELLLAAKEPAEPGGVEIHVIGATFLYPWRGGGRDLEKRAGGGWPRRRFMDEEPGDAPHSRHSIAHVPSGP